MQFLLPAAPITTLDEYLATDTGGLGLARARMLGRRGTIDEVTRSGLRGRGGGGFPTGRKWAGVRDQTGTHRYVVANGAEGEPGTFKDRMLLRTNPYQVIEGVLIAAFAVDAIEAFVAVKASFAREADALTRAVLETQQAGIGTECQVTIVRGPDEYLFGEEKALLEVIEGRDPLPRLLPPYEHGLFATAPQAGWEAVDVEPGHHGQHESNPTLVNNVETLANVPHILARGADWFRSSGTRDSPGTVVATVVGDVVRPGVHEVELGTSLLDLIELAGGPPAGRRVKAVTSGVANAVLTGDQLAVPLSHDAFRALGSGLGAAGFIVHDDTACMVEVARQISQFLYVESCGQCPPCKRGSGEVTAILGAIQSGTAAPDDLASLRAWLRQVTDGARCGLARSEQVVVGSIVEVFAGEVDEHLRTGHCPRPRPIAFPKIVDLGESGVSYELHWERKQPDWTYAPG